MAGAQFLPGVRDFSLFHSLFSSGYKGLCLRIKLPSHEADHSPPCSAEVKNDEAKHFPIHLFALLVYEFLSVFLDNSHSVKPSV
jgi:hypothetical protein